MIAYAGIGARKTPVEILKKMALYGAVFAKLGYVLRSGGAQGADAAFERGCDLHQGPKEIYLPWQGYNSSNSALYNITEHAYTIAEEVYGLERWRRVSSGVKKLMARNIYQVLGLTLDTPSRFVIAWTPDGIETAEQRTRKTGGTGQAIACASQYSIPVFNLQNEDAEDRLLDFIGAIDEQ